MRDGRLNEVVKPSQSSVQERILGLKKMTDLCSKLLNYCGGKVKLKSGSVVFM